MTTKCLENYKYFIRDYVRKFDSNNRKALKKLRFENILDESDKEVIPFNSLYNKIKLYTRTMFFNKLRKNTDYEPEAMFDTIIKTIVEYNTITHNTYYITNGEREDSPKYLEKYFSDICEWIFTKNKEASFALVIKNKLYGIFFSETSVGDKYIDIHYLGANEGDAFNRYEYCIKVEKEQEEYKIIDKNYLLIQCYNSKKCFEDKGNISSVDRCESCKHSKNVEHPLNILPIAFKLLYILKEKEDEINNKLDTQCSIFRMLTAKEVDADVIRLNDIKKFKYVKVETIEKENKSVRKVSSKKQVDKLISDLQKDFDI